MNDDRMRTLIYDYDNRISVMFYDVRGVCAQAVQQRSDAAAAHPQSHHRERHYRHAAYCRELLPGAADRTVRSSRAHSLNRVSFRGESTAIGAGKRNLAPRNRCGPLDVATPPFFKERASSQTHRHCCMFDT